jgi:hypothetical protein
VEAKKQRLQFKKFSHFFPRKAAMRERENDFNSLRTTGLFSPSTFGFFAINPHLTHISESHPHLSFPEKESPVPHLAFKRIFQGHNAHTTVFDTITFSQAARQNRQKKPKNAKRWTNSTN